MRPWLGRSGAQGVPESPSPSTDPSCAVSSRNERGFSPNARGKVRENKAWGHYIMLAPSLPTYYSRMCREGCLCAVVIHWHLGTTGTLSFLEAGHPCPDSNPGTGLDNLFCICWCQTPTMWPTWTHDGSRQVFQGWGLQVVLQASSFQAVLGG